MESYILVVATFPKLFVRESTSVVLPQSGRVAREPYVKELTRHILAVGFANYSGIPRFP